MMRLYVISNSPPPPVTLLFLILLPTFYNFDGFHYSVFIDHIHLPSPSPLALPSFQWLPPISAPTYVHIISTPFLLRDKSSEEQLFRESEPESSRPVSL
jgi:hypothetical protein